MSFKEAVEEVLRKEGGGKVHKVKNDNGGLTKWGISQRAYPRLDIANLSKSEAIAIYKADYWDELRCDEIPDSVATELFTAGVNMGTRTVAKLIQKTVCVKVDGVVGNQTVRAINMMDDKIVVLAFNHLVVNRYREICNRSRSQKKFLLGWLNRVYG
jgi:lysozyme family protein